MITRELKWFPVFQAIGLMDGGVGMAEQAVERFQLAAPELRAHFSTPQKLEDSPAGNGGAFPLGAGHSPESMELRRAGRRSLPLDFQEASTDAALVQVPLEVEAIGFTTGDWRRAYSLRRCPLALGRSPNAASIPPPTAISATVDGSGITGKIENDFKPTSSLGV